MASPDDAPTQSAQGSFKRKPTSFRHVVSSASSRFPAEPGRYHLYVSHACPWAHRCMVVRALKGLEDVIGVSVVDWANDELGWKFASAEDVPGCVPDTVNGAQRVRELYFKAEPNFEGRFTVPILWDTKESTIVNNESSEILRMLNSEFNQWARDPDLDLYPEGLRERIDEVNKWVYPAINDGVYRCGFASTQEAYEEAFHTLFEALDRAEVLLAHNRYLCGERFTEADVRLWTTLVRFDPVYATHFKCNRRLIREMPNLLGFLREIYQMPGVAGVVNFEHIIKHYYYSHTSVNPRRVWALGNPQGSLLTHPHCRDPERSHRKNALIVVDMQVDFCPPNGSLAVGEGDLIVPLVNKLKARRDFFDLVVLTQDWHPADHCSFADNNPGSTLFQPFKLPSGQMQMMWPTHCVQGSVGAEFHPDMVRDPDDIVVQKGLHQHIDSYSGFFDNNHESKTELLSVLRKNEVTHVYLVGLAFDYCVGFSALDAKTEGFQTFLFEDVSRGVAPETTAAMKETLNDAGVWVIDSSTVFGSSLA